jgi:hypothetical protein
MQLIVSLFVVMSGLELGLNYYLPSWENRGLDRSFRFLIFNDNSSDSLPKQALAQELGAEGCTPDRVSSPDPRIAEALRFLEIGDWPIRGEASCPGSRIRVARASQKAEIFSPEELKHSNIFQQFVMIY